MMMKIETRPAVDATLSGTALILIGTTAFSAKAILIKLAYVYPVDASTLLALRMAFSLPFFLVIALWQSVAGDTPIGLRDAGSAALLGLLGFYLASLLDFQGLLLVSAGLERVILFLYPTLVVLLSGALYRRPVARSERLALVLSYVGIGLIVADKLSVHGERVALGALLVFGSAFAYASYLIGSGRLIKRMGVLRFTSYAMVVSCSMAIGQFAVSHPLHDLELPMPVYELAATMAIISTVLPTFLISAGIKQIGSSKAALLGATGPVVTILMAVYFLNERVTTLQVVGTAMVMAGVLAVTRTRKG